MQMDEQMKRKLLRFQRNEITESIVYKKLARIEKNPANRDVLLQIGADELRHYEILCKHTGRKVSPNNRRIFKFYWLARIFGLTFAVKLMEKGEANAKYNYLAYEDYPDIQEISIEEEKHELFLLGLINEERLSYMGSVVLGLNDALVEFTGALAGFTLALNDSRLIALIGAITGISAALSMASSEYLSTKSDGESRKRALRASTYTGIAYIFTVIALVSPFIFINNVLIALACMLVIALAIIALFNYYYSIARGESFKKRFSEMAALSFSVAAISFLIGYALKKFTGIEV